MTDISPTRPVAYFCAEYGLRADLPLYAGGLGVLAGDTVKEAADQNLPMVAVGLLYRGVKAKQKIDESGWQTEEDVPVDPINAGFEHVSMPDNPDQPLFVRVQLTQTDVWAKVWKQTVNFTTIYLLDTDTEQNAPEERGITSALYFGGEEVLIKQQMILGIGGVKVLTALGIEPALYHINEGRPAFLVWQLIRQIMDRDKIDCGAAQEKARQMVVYTNHTLVKAGNKGYNINHLQSYSLYYAEKMGVGIDELLSGGFDEETGSFNMTEFAIKNSRKASAVSQAHFQLSKNLWPDREWVGITNGVHLPTWQDPEIRDCDKTGEDLWWVHNKKKKELSDFVAARTGFAYDPSRLIIGWARRIAGYKRPLALFEDVKRLEKIVKNQEKPVHILVSGRAHAKDLSAKKLIQKMIKIMGKELSGYAIFVPNYDIDVARMMVKGVDIWLNTPLLGQEASGTSGMKAIANGVLQLTVEGGWAAEVDWHDIGWTLDGNHLTETLYFRLEDDVVPKFYHRDEKGVPIGWLKKMKSSIELAGKFSSARMLKEYREQLYN